MNLLGPHVAHPAPLADERREWLSAHWPEIVMAAEAELPDTASERQKGSAAARIALARWRVYLRGPREYRESAALSAMREKSDRRQLEIAQEKAAPSWWSDAPLPHIDRI